MSATATLFMVLPLVWISTLSAERLHSLRIDRIEPHINKEWIAGNFTIQIRKLNKNEKLVNVLITILKDFTEEIVCETKIYQKIGGKYLKAPVDYPKIPFCRFLANNRELWPCVWKFSNLPGKCPITKGSYEVKQMNINECSTTLQLPPNAPEHYKLEFQMFNGPIRVFKLATYVIAKRKFQIF